MNTDCKRIGIAKGLISDINSLDDFNSLDKEIAELFYGSDEENEKITAIPTDENVFIYKSREK